MDGFEEKLQGKPNHASENPLKTKTYPFGAVQHIGFIFTSWSRGKSGFGICCFKNPDVAGKATSPVHFAKPRACWLTLMLPSGLWDLMLINPWLRNRGMSPFSGDSLLLEGTPLQ